MPDDLPKGWQAIRVGKFARERSERNKSGAIMPVLSMTKHRGFVRSSDYFSRSVHSDNTDNYKVVRRGQFAYATIHLDEGSIDFLRSFDAGLISPMYTIFELTSDGADRDFVFRSLKRFALSGRFDPYSNGGVNRRKSISFDDLKAFNFPMPPIAEQRAIVDVLGAVEAGIRKTEALIEALSESQNALLRGYFDRKKNSLHWSTVGKVGRWRSGGTPATAKAENWNGSVPWVCPKDIKGPTVNETIDRISQEAAEALGMVQPGTLLLIVRGMILARAVPSTICKVRCAFNQDVKAFVPRDGVQPAFLKLWLDINEQKLLGEIETATHGTKRFPLESLNAFPVPMLADHEQREVIALFDTGNGRIQAEKQHLRQLIVSRDGLAQELLSGRLRLPESMIARHADAPDKAA